METNTNLKADIEKALRISNKHDLAVAFYKHLPDGITYEQLKSLALYQDSFIKLLSRCVSDSAMDLVKQDINKHNKPTKCDVDYAIQIPYCGTITITTKINTNSADLKDGTIKQELSVDGSNHIAFYEQLSEYFKI